MKKSFKKPHQFKKSKPLIFKKKFWVGLLVFLVLAGVFYLVLFFDFFWVKEIEVSGNQKVSSEDIRGMFEGKLDSVEALE